MLSASSIFSLNLLNITIGLIYFTYCLNRMMSRKSILFLPISSSVFVLTNFLTIGFLPQIGGEKYNTNDILINSSISGLIFIFICLGAQLFYDLISKITLRKKINAKHDIKFSYSATYLLYIFIIIVIFGFIRFVFFSGGINYIGMILLESGDSYKHNVVRLELGKLLNSLPGAGLAGMSLQYISPALVSCLFILLLRSQKKRKLFFKTRIYFLIILLVLTSIVFAMIFAKKAMLIYTFIFPLILFVFSQRITYLEPIYKVNFERINLLFNKNTNRAKKIQKSKLKNFFIATFLIFITLVAVTVTYSVAQGSKSDEAIILLFQRIFFVPAQVSAAYYALFPSVFPFRGIENMFSFSGDISFTDISLAFTGNTSVATANFIAISYSAGGFFPVILASFIYSILTLIHDNFLEKQEKISKNLIFIASVNGLYAVCSAPLNASIINFGYLLPTIILFFCLRKKRLPLITTESIAPALRQSLQRALVRSE